MPWGEGRGEGAFCIKLISISLTLLLFTSCGLRTSRLTPTPVTGHEWPVWRGGLANTGAALNDQAPVLDTLLWRIKTGGVAATEPVIHGGYIFFGGWDRRLEIFRASDGGRVFRGRFKGPVTGIAPLDSTFLFATDQDERKLFVYTANPVSEIRATAIPTTSVPPRVLDDGSVIVTGMRGSLVRFDTTGGVIWNLSFDDPITAAPAVDDSLVIVATGRKLMARRLSDGVAVWTHSASGAIAAAPAVGQHVYFGSTDSLVYALDRAHGSMVWFFSTGGQVLTTPTVGDSIVYVASNDRSIYALHAATGRKVWSYDTGAPAKNNVTLAGDALLVGSLLNKLLVLDATTGDLRRSFDLQAAAATAPIIAGGRVYIGDTRRRLYCFGPKPAQAPSPQDYPTRSRTACRATAVIRRTTAKPCHPGTGMAELPCQNGTVICHNVM
ncbi:MAG: PQQ-binding-like beta-propeller repeat protein [Candidatus Zixiibacteriota bacterium]